MDIDSVSFNPKNFVLNLLKQNSIKQLIRKNNEVEEEIKIHDHEIQSLVFENYSKFISSIDTVREMKDNICRVDDRLKVLESSMEKIEKLALKIDDTFSVKRKEIQKLDTINKDLEKLKNLCDFPHVLKQDLTYYKSLAENRLISELDDIFSKSVVAYEACYKTLIDLKEQPLIAPIYRDSYGRVDQMRSIFKALQVQMKSRVSNAVLRKLTKKLLIVTDDQVSVLRIYFHSWKERLSETCFKPLVNGAAISQVNEDLWREFDNEFEYLYVEVYDKLRIDDDDVLIHIYNFTKELFIWALGNFADSAQLHCVTLKGYVYAHHIVSGSLNRALQKVKQRQNREDSKQLYEHLQSKMDERIQGLTLSVLHTVFARVKVRFADQVLETKTRCLEVGSSEESLKETHIRLGGPLKDTLQTHYKQLLDDMEFLRNNSELIFKTQEKFEKMIHQQVESFVKAVAKIIAKPACLISQETYLLFYPTSIKPHRNERVLVEKTVKALLLSQQSPSWFIVANNFLSTLNNTLAKRIIEHTHKYIEMTKNHDYGEVFSEIKKGLSANLIAFASHFSNLVGQRKGLQAQHETVISFLEVLNAMFVDYRRSLLKKPSFLAEENNFSIEAEMLAIKKMRLTDRKTVCDLNSALSFFIKKTLKQVLAELRSGRNTMSQSDVYGLMQVCYELSNVDEEAQICAFYHLIKQNWAEPAKWSQNYKPLEESYAEVRK